MTVGFPMNKYAEQHFELTEMDRDRGFQLKNFGEKGWGLFDRISLAVIMPVNGSADKVMAVTKPADNSFATVLADVTGDSTLIQKKPEVKPPENSKKQLMAVSTPVRDSLIKDDRVKKDVISNTIMQENEELKVLGYIIANSAGKNDTIYAEINKPIVQPVLAKVPVCDRPFADIKDFKSLQRKILGSSDAAEQILFVVKAYKVKCFSSKQTLDLGWMVTDESVRLRLFEALKGLVSDPGQFGQLETAFMKDENVQAFRKLMGKN